MHRHSDDGDLERIGGPALLGADRQMTPAGHDRPEARDGRVSGPDVRHGVGHRSVLDLQRLVGNRAVVTILRQPEEAAPAEDGIAEGMSVTEEFVPDPAVGPPDTAPRAQELAPATGFSDGGMTGTVPFGDARHALYRHHPHAFTDGGMTGTVVWSGGGGAGARGNQGAGSIQTQIPPTFTSAAGPTAGRFSSSIGAGTGRVAVTRSWVGAFSGDQGNGWFLTAGAVARINQHERNHVASSRGFYATHLAPLETRVANAALGRDAGDTGAAAITAHQAAIRWVPTITAFQTADTAANQAGGTVDAADVAAGWIVDHGPGNVLGVAFTHRVTSSAEAAPPTAAPAPAPAPGP